MENACVGAPAFSCTDCCTIEISQRAGQSSRLVTRSLSPADIPGSLSTHISGTSSAMLRRPIELLDLPDAVLNLIVSFVFPRLSDSNYIIVDPYVMARHSAQSFANTAEGNVVTYKLCMTRPNAKAISAAASSLVLVNRRLNVVATNQLYTRRCFVFTSPAIALSFLHDHRAAKYQLRRMRLILWSSNSPAGWRRLFNVIVHECSQLQEFILWVDPHFWTDAPWRQGPQAVLDLQPIVPYFYFQSAVATCWRMRSPTLWLWYGPRCELCGAKTRDMSRNGYGLSELPVVGII